MHLAQPRVTLVSRGVSLFLVSTGFALALLVALRAAEPPSFDWVRNVGGGSASLKEEPLALGPDGGLHIAGLFFQQAQFGGITLGSTDLVDHLFVASFSPAGEVRWAVEERTTGPTLGLMTAYPTALATDKAGGVWVGGLRSIAHFGEPQGFLGRYTEQGRQWACELPYAPDGGLGIDREGRAWLAYRDPNGPAGTVVVRCDAAGNPTNFFGFAAFAQLGIGAGGDSVVVGGTFGGRLPLPEGDELAAWGGTDVFLAAFDAQGRKRWRAQVSGPGYCSLQRLALDAEGNVYVLGRFDGELGFDGLQLGNAENELSAFLAKYDASGSAVWARKLDLRLADYRLVVTASGEPRLAGSLRGVDTVQFGSDRVLPRGNGDWLILGFSRNGEPKWVQQPTGGAGGSLLGAVGGTDESLVLLGAMSGPQSFDCSVREDLEGGLILARLGVIESSPSAPSLLTQPQSVEVFAPSVASLSVLACGSAPLSYAWRLDGKAISGADRYSVVARTSGVYSVVVGNRFGAVTSEVAAVTVNSVCTPSQVRLLAPGTFAWSTNGVAVTLSAEVDPGDAPTTVWFELSQDEFRTPPLLVTAPVIIEPNVGMTRVADRLSELVAGGTYAFRVRVTNHHGGCFFGGEGSGRGPLTTPTNAWTTTTIGFGFTRPLMFLVDADGDGSQEALTVPVSMSASAYATLVYSLGPFAYAQELASIQPTLGPRIGVTWIDFSGDGKPDILRAETASNGAGRTELVAHRNRGDATFELQATSPAGPLGGTWVPIDVDHDGREDLLTLGQTNYLEGPAGVWLYRSVEEGKFALGPDVGLPALLSPLLAQAGDFDGDGWADLLLSGVEGGREVTRAYLHRHDGTFAPAVGGLEVGLTTSAAWADFDGDGRTDLALAGMASTNVPFLRLFRYEPAAGFQEMGEGYPRDWRGKVAAGDLNMDGQPDLALFGPGGGIYLNRGAARMERASGDFDVDLDLGRLTGFEPSAVWVRDADGDGDSDLVTCNYGDMVVLRNDGAPPRPPRLKAERDPAGIVLRIEGSRGRRHTVGSSDDLVRWEKGESLMNVSGTVTVRYPTPVAVSPNFFRVVVEP